MQLRQYLWLAICLAVVVPTAQAEVVNGRSYLSLSSWARANGFGGYSLNRGTEWILTNKTSRLVFAQDSADSTINGQGVRLCFPIAKGGLISQLDVEKTVRPLVFPQAPSSKRLRLICLDPGHGGKDTGNRVGRFFPRYEKTYTLALALELQRQLREAGFAVIMTRTNDTYPPLPVRPDLANRKGADLFVSLHFNSSPNDPGGVSGPETYCITPVGAASSNDAEGEGAGSGPCPANRCEDKSLLLAYQVERSLVRSLGMNDRSVRRARFEVLRTTQMPAILIEGGYMSHPEEGRKIFDAGWRRQMAAAIVRGIQNYAKLTAPAPSRHIANAIASSEHQ
jgi:N-acetylmuramoyl-L-alanine amidase